MNEQQLTQWVRDRMDEISDGVMAQDAAIRPTVIMALDIGGGADLHQFGQSMDGLAMLHGTLKKSYDELNKAH